MDKIPNKFEGKIDDKTLDRLWDKANDLARQRYQQGNISHSEYYDGIRSNVYKDPEYLQGFLDCFTACRDDLKKVKPELLGARQAALFKLEGMTEEQLFESPPIEPQWVSSRPQW